MRISDVMTPDTRTIAPDRTVRDAARLMDELNVGVLPVCQGERLVGVVTDRDIVVRSTAAGETPGDQRVEAVMTVDPTTCSPDDEAGAVLERMSALQVRRMPVVGPDGRLVGIVSLGDLAADGAPGADQALRHISTPAEPDRSGTPSTARADAARDPRPAPLTDAEQGELARRLEQASGPRDDRGRAPDGAGGAGAPGLTFTDEDDVRAAFGSFGNPASGPGNAHMPGGFGGDGYANYGQNFGPGAQRAAPVPLTDANPIGRPDEEADRPESGPTTSGPASAEEGHVGRTLFSSGSHDPASGRGEGGEPESGAGLADATGNPGIGTAGATAGSPSGGRTRGE